MSPSLFLSWRLALPVAFLILVSLYADFTMDDAFIAFRYSDHLAQGLGLVWNPGEDPVEGYTSFLWVLLNAAAIFFRLDPAVFSKVFGTACAIATIWLLVSSSRRLPWAIATILVGLIAYSPLYAFLTIQGLETPLAALLLLAASFLSLELTREPTGQTIAGWYAACLLAALTRPDTIPFSAGLFLGTLGVIVANGGFASWRRFLGIGAIFVALGSLYFAWRVAYFGHLFPNPYYIKMAGEGAVPGERRADAFYSVGSFLQRLFFPYVLGGAYLLLRRAVPKERVLTVFPILLACTFFGLYLLTITPIQGYFWRFVFPAVPSLCLAAIHLFSSYRPAGRSAIAIVLIAVFFVLWNLRFLPETFQEKELRSTRNRELVGRSLAGLDGTMFISASGALAYYSGWNAVDKLGLNSERIAHHGLSIETLEEINPDLISVKSNAEGIYRGGMIKHLVVHRYMIRHGGFEAVAAVHRSFGFHMYYFARRNSELFDEIADRLLHLEGVEYGDLQELMREKRIPIYAPERESP